MFHWYLLLRRSAGKPPDRAGGPAGARIIAGGGRGGRRETSPPGERLRLLALGFVEAVPLGVGAAAATYLQAPLASWGALAGGFLTTLAVCWLLRGKAPELPVELARAQAPGDQAVSTTPPGAGDDGPRPRESTPGKGTIGLSAMPGCVDAGRSRIRQRTFREVARPATKNWSLSIGR